MNKIIIQNFARIVLASFGFIVILSLVGNFYDVSINSRHRILDEIIVGTPAVDYAIIFGMTFENWDFPNYLLALTSGMDALISILVGALTQDWRTAKIIRYSLALICVIFLFLSSLNKLLDIKYSREDIEIEILKVVAVLCYVFSPYSFMLMNYGVFWSFSVYFSIACFPMVIIYFVKRIMSLDQQWSYSEGFGFGLLVGVSCWWVPFAVVMFSSSVLVCVLFQNKITYKETWIGAAPLLAGLVFGLIPVIITTYYMFLAPGVLLDFQIVENSGFDRIKGGVLTPFLHKHSWLLYERWGPKSMAEYFEDFDQPWIRLIYLAFIGTMTYAALTKVKRSPYLSLFFCFFIIYLSSVFLAKGASYPFGDVFTSLQDISPIFKVVRTPDSKYGLALTVSLILCCVLASTFSRLVMRTFITLGILYLVAAIPLWWSGEIYNPTGRARYITSISNDEELAVAYLNNTGDDERVLLLPGTGGGEFENEGYIYAGRHYITTILNRKLISVQDGAVIEKNASNIINKAIKKWDVLAMKEMGIGYILIDKRTAPKQYNELRSISDEVTLKIVVDGKRIALFEIKGDGKPFEVIDALGREVQAKFYRNKMLPLGFTVLLNSNETTEMPLSVRADVVVSSHWLWLPLGDSENNIISILNALIINAKGRQNELVSDTKVSRVGLAEWSISKNQWAGEYRANKNWIVIHMPNLVLTMAMLSCILLGVFLLIKWSVCKANEYIVRSYFSH